MPAFHDPSQPDHPVFPPAEYYQHRYDDEDPGEIAAGARVIVWMLGTLALVPLGVFAFALWWLA